MQPSRVLLPKVILLFHEEIIDDAQSLFFGLAYTARDGVHALQYRGYGK